MLLAVLYTRLTVGKQADKKGGIGKFIFTLEQFQTNRALIFVLCFFLTPYTVI